MPFIRIYQRFCSREREKKTCSDIRYVVVAVAIVAAAVPQQTAYNNLCIPSRSGEKPKDAFAAPIKYFHWIR